MVGEIHKSIEHTSFGLTEDPDLVSLAHFYDHDRDYWQSFLSRLGISNHHVYTLMRLFYSSAEQDVESTFLPKVLKDALRAQNIDIPVHIDSFKTSGYDRSTKFLIKLKRDGLAVEAVLMPERKRTTICISSQVGCAQGCSFCQTGRMGLIRQLSPGEIVGQIIAVKRWMDADDSQALPPLTNVALS